MNNNEMERLNFENLIWLIFIILNLLNIKGDNEEKKFLQTNNQKYAINSSQIFTITLIVTFIIYIYFFERNLNAYQKATDKQLYLIKLLGSSFLIAGVICLIYFQTKQNSFIGSPAL